MATLSFSAVQLSWVDTGQGHVVASRPSPSPFRLYRGVHYPTDVLGSTLLAITWLAITYTLLMRRRAGSSSSNDLQPRRPRDNSARG